MSDSTNCMFSSTDCMTKITFCILTITLCISTITFGIFDQNILINSFNPYFFFVITTLFTL